MGGLFCVYGTMLGGGWTFETQSFDFVGFFYFIMAEVGVLGLGID